MLNSLIIFTNSKCCLFYSFNFLVLASFLLFFEHCNIYSITNGKKSIYYLNDKIFGFLTNMHYLIFQFSMYSTITSVMGKNKL